METFLPITYLNDFVFCPYSIYLHQVFDNNAEDLYSASPQQRGRIAHSDIDEFDVPTKPDEEKTLKGIYVISMKLGIYGKIDTYYTEEKKLVESKYQIQTLYRGYYYQLWSQYFALTEMGHPVHSLYFYSIRDRRCFDVPIPTEKDFQELKAHIRQIAWFNFEGFTQANFQKCMHCIYTSLCDKTQQEHVYT